jgi:hypothetical protein
MAVFSDRYEIEHARVITIRKDARGKPTAIMVASPAWDAAQWIPWGQVDDDSPTWRPGDAGTVIVSAWLADKRGWK